MSTSERTAEAGSTESMQEKAHGHLVKVVAWMESATFSERAMAVAYDILSNPEVADILRRKGLYDGDIADDLDAWRRELEDPDADRREEVTGDPQGAISYFAGVSYLVGLTDAMG